MTTIRQRRHVTNSAAAPDEVTRSVESTLLREARLLEVRLAYVRGICTALSAGILVVSYLLPRQTVGAASIPAVIPLLQVGICVVAVTIAFVLSRGWYRPWLRAALPVLDGGLILILSLTVLWTVFRPVIGDTVNTASRLEALTKDHGVEVIVSEETVQRVTDGDRPLLRVIGDVKVRGRQQALRIRTLAPAS